MPFLAALALSALVAQAASPDPHAGDAAFARGDFQAAFLDYNTAIAKNPFDADAILGLGTLDLYRNDWENARVYLNRANKLAPNDPRTERRLAVLAQRLPKPGRYHFEFQGEQSDVPFVAMDPVPVIKATIGTRIVTLAVDTTAGSIELSPAAAQSSGVTDGEIVPTITLPNVTVSNVPVSVVAHQYPGSVAVDGAIGTVFLTHFLPTFDYAHGRLTLRRWESSPALEKTAAASGAAIEPLWLVDDRLLFAAGRVGASPRALFAIETANGDGAVAVPGEAQSPSTIALVSLGRYAQGPVPAGAFDDSRYHALPFEVGGAFHNAFFRPATLTLDFAAMKIIVSK